MGSTVDRVDPPPTTLRWAASPALATTVLGAVLLAGGGLLLSRVELVLLALPLIASAALTRAPRGLTRVTVAVPGGTAGDGARAVGYVVGIRTPAGTGGVQLTLAALDGRPRELIVTAATARRLSGQVPILHSGPQQLLQLHYRLLGADAAFTSSPTDPLSIEHIVAPPFTAARNLPLPKRLTGLAGGHNSARPGDGGEFRDIHPFTPGDRLRRIDWKATARRGQSAGDLYVRRTTATADATVLLVIDSRDDLGENVADWSRGSAVEKGISSLDLARSAASALAAGYLRSADRVGFHDLGQGHRAVNYGSGARHLDRVLTAIAHTATSGYGWHRERPPVVVPGALIYLFSTYFDDEAARVAALWHAAGHRVIAVDVLPEPRWHPENRQQVVAHRIVLLERSERIRELANAGVELLPWHTPAVPEAALRSLARPTRGRAS